LGAYEGCQYTLENIERDYTINAQFIVINNAPVSIDKSISFFEDTVINSTLTASDLDNDEVEFNIKTLPIFGVLDLKDKGSGVFSYTPNSNYFGSDSFTFIANDGKIDSNLATISLLITAVNDIPQTYDATIQLDEDSFVSDQLKAFDADNDLLSYTIVRQATKGLAEITSHKTGTFVYTPYPDSNGDDSFSFVVSDNESTSEASVIDIHIKAENDLPQTSGQILKTGERQAINITLLAEDKDNDPLDFYLKSLPLYGQIICMGYTIDKITESLPDSQLVYVPDPNYIGLDTISFYVNDGHVDSNTSVIQIQIGGSDIQTDEDTPIDLTNILPESITISQQPEHGTITVREAKIYTPDVNYYGFDQFKYIDGEQEKVFRIHISPVNDSPIITNDQNIYLLEDQPTQLTIFVIDIDKDNLTFQISEPEHGKISGTPPVYLYYPDENFFGTDTVSIEVSDASESAQMTITLNIEAVNDPPVVVDINAQEIEEDNQLSLKLNGSDIDSKSLEYQVTVIDGQRVDNTGDKIPFIGIPMLLNPLSKFYEQILQSPELWLYVEEKGDQESGFRAEKLLIEPEIKSDGGVVYIKMNHLTSVGLGLGAMPGEEKEEPEAECVGCEKTSNCFLETIMGW
jgi:hypothetical protein